MKINTVDIDRPSLVDKISHGGDLEWATWSGHPDAGGGRVSAALPRRIRPHGVSVEEWERQQAEETKR